MASHRSLPIPAIHVLLRPCKLVVPEIVLWSKQEKPAPVFALSNGQYILIQLHALHTRSVRTSDKIDVAWTTAAQ